MAERTPLAHPLRLADSLGRKVPLSDDAIAARIAGKGKWKQSLAPLIDTLIALGRARRVKTGVLAID